MQDRLLALESRREGDRQRDAKRAQLRADMEKGESLAFLVITNAGQSEARAISIRVDGQPIHHEKGKESDFLVHANEVGTRLGASGQVRYPMVLHMGVKAKLDVHLEWEDDSGVMGSWRSDLTWWR